MRKGYRLEVTEYSSSKMVDTTSSSSYGEVLNENAIKDKQKEIDKKIEQEENHDKNLAKYTAMYPSKCPQCKSSITVKGKEKSKFKVDISPSINFVRAPFVSYNGQPLLTVGIFKKLLCLYEKNPDDASPVRYHYSVRVVKSDNKEKYDYDAEIAKNKKKNILKKISVIKNNIDELIEKAKTKNKKKITNENTPKLLIKNQEEEKHNLLPKLWNDWGYRKYHERLKIKKEEIFGDNAEIEKIKNVRELIKKQHEKDHADLQKIIDGSSWSMGNDMINVKCLAVTPLNPLGVEKIPKPIPLRKIVTDVSDIKTSKKNVPYRKELTKLNSQLRKLREDLDYWQNQYDDARQNMFEYKCKTCKMGLGKNCLACRDDYIELHGSSKLYEDGLDKNTREFNPLLKIYPSFPVNKASPDDVKGIPVCNECVSKWGKEEIKRCL